MDSFDLLVNTRTAEPQEYARVVELTHETYDPTDNNSKADRAEDINADWIDKASKDGKAEVAVAYDSATETIVASGIGVIDDGDVQENTNGYIRWMSTTEDFRGYGVGEQILNHLMNWFAEKGVARVQLHASDKASEFYSQHGFEKDSSTNMWSRKA